MATILLLLIKYKYLILFPIVVVEGPFATMISGFLISTHVFNVFIAYPVVVFADLAGDTIFYLIGRWSGVSLLKHTARFGVTEEKLETAKKYFANHHHKALMASKLIHGVGVSGLIAAGVLKISFYKYLRTCFFIALCQSAFLLLLGFIFGHAYLQIGQYLNIYAKIISIIALLALGWFIFSKLKGSFKFANQ